MINKKISRLISKLKKDFRSIHHTQLSKNFLKDNFRFNYNKNEISDSGLDRIFSFAEYIYKDNKKKLSGFNKNDIWTEFTKKKDHNNLEKICLEKDKSKFKQTLDELGKSDLIYGLSNFSNYQNLLASEKEKDKEASQLIDKLISLSEYTKHLKVYNPEHGGGGWIIDNLDFQDLIKKIFVAEDKEIVPFKSPNYTFGYQIEDKFYSIKDFLNFYTSIRMNEIIKNNKSLEIISEIGAGLGHAAYYSKMLNNKHYNIYDLPNILILQAYYLMLSLSENEVHLANEKKNNFAKVSLYPYWEIFNLPILDNTLWLNQDSLPQIDINIAKEYINKLKLGKNSFFLSINQESKNANTNGKYQFPVHEIIKLSNSNFKKIYRSRDFLRLGFIEELYYW